MPKRKIIFYQPYLKEIARKLRNRSTLSEALLWQYLKGKQMMGYDFHRQKPLLAYIVDFYCYELNLIIEIDGDSHDVENVYIADRHRQAALEKVGLHFLRFDDLEVKRDMNGVLWVISKWIDAYEESISGLQSGG